MSGTDGSPNPFTLLADETRLGVIEAIGDRSGDGSYACLSYSTIQDAVGCEDSGKLNYHLRKLRGTFVEQTDDGYQLLLPGMRVYQAVSAGRFDRENPEVEPRDYGHSCPDCDAPLTFAYRDGRYFIECPSCETIHARNALSPVSFDPEDPETLRAVGSARAFLSARSMNSGVCPHCDSRVERELTTGEEAEASEYTAIARKWCSQCGWYGYSNVNNVVMTHPITRAFLLDHGLIDHVNQSFVEEVTIESTIRSEDPWRVEVAVRAPMGTVRHVIDGDLESVEWTVED